MKKVLKTMRKRIKFTDHAFNVMYSAERMVTVDEVIEALLNGDIIEDYPDDPRGHSCLILGYTKKHRPIHIVCAPKPKFLTIITAYEPTLNKWEPNLRTRRKP
jgi:hypothetical protein